MKLKVLFVAILLSLFVSERLSAQRLVDLFKLPDTVCANHEIAPFDIIEGAVTYSWSFCPPSLDVIPEAQSLGYNPNIVLPAGMVVARDKGVPYSFHINQTGHVVRMKYEEGLEGPRSFITGLGRIAPRGGGIFALNHNDTWQIFALGGTEKNNTQFVRYEFGNGLIQPPTKVVNMGSLGDSLDAPIQLHIAQDNNGDWYGFTFNRGQHLVRMSFGSNPLSVPKTRVLGNIEGKFLLTSGIAGVEELGNYHIFVTDRTANELYRLSFGDSYLNNPHIVPVEAFGNYISNPAGISIIRECEDYYAYVINRGTNSLITLHWDQSIADTPTTWLNSGQVGNIQLPSFLSPIARDKGGYYMFTASAIDSTIARIEMKPCTYSSLPGIDQRTPPTFKYTDPGVQKVILTIDEGLPTEQTVCEYMYVEAHPSIAYNKDTMICLGDTIRLEFLTYQPDSIKWSPYYHISDTVGSFISAYPPISQEYTVTTYYNEQCIIRNNIFVDVNKIVADAGPDRILGDGSETILGGALTTIGHQYGYVWDPPIGIIGPLNTPHTAANPPYDITYHLWVYDTNGCQAVDSVNILVPCDEINVPNAFNPTSHDPVLRTFGPQNQQFGRINSFRVYDRWGQEVFSTSEPGVRWDGNDRSGMPVALGVYVWEIDAVCDKTLRRIRKAGSVTLIR